MTTPGATQVDEIDNSILYHISFQRVAELNRSLALLVASRLCEACRSRLSPAGDLTDPQALMREIAKHCTGEDGYINLTMPMQEIIVRILLLRRNQPISLGALHYELTEKWASPLKPMNITEKGLQSILEADDYYGFAALTRETSKAEQ